MSFVLKLIIVLIAVSPILSQEETPIDTTPIVSTMEPDYDPPVEPMAPEEPLAESADPVAPMTEPTEEPMASSPTVPEEPTDPIAPVTEPTDPVAPVSEPVAEPTSPIADTTEPTAPLADEPSPIEVPSEPTTAPTTPSSDSPTEPVVEPLGEPFTPYAPSSNPVADPPTSIVPNPEPQESPVTPPQTMEPSVDAPIASPNAGSPFAPESVTPTAAVGGDITADNTLSTGALAGIIVGCAVVALLAIIIPVAVKRKRDADKKKMIEMANLPMGGTSIARDEYGRPGVKETVVEMNPFAAKAVSGPEDSERSDEESGEMDDGSDNSSSVEDDEESGENDEGSDDSESQSYTDSS